MSFGRDLRSNLFHQVTDFSSREVGAFGAPSLITRITNDVQQVQLLTVMLCTMAVAAPITIVVGLFFALRLDLGLSIVLVFAIPIAAVVLGATGYGACMWWQRESMHLQTLVESLRGASHRTLSDPRPFRPTPTLEHS